MKVLAQSSPNDNLLLVEALKERGDVVAATWMGIQDPNTLMAVCTYHIKTQTAAQDNININTE